MLICLLLVSDSGPSGGFCSLLPLMTEQVPQEAQTYMAAGCMELALCLCPGLEDVGIVMEGLGLTLHHCGEDPLHLGKRYM